MTNEDFEKLCEEGFKKSMEVLNKKKTEYSEGKDRLCQFKQVAALNDEPATRSLWGMAAKHVSSIAGMVKEPENYTPEMWQEKLIDLRNYTFLLEGVLIDLSFEDGCCIHCGALKGEL